MKYPKLIGVCATAIKNNLCTGCNRLEIPEFRGLKNCKYVEKENWKQEEIWKTK